MGGLPEPPDPRKYARGGRLRSIASISYASQILYRSFTGFALSVGESSLRRFPTATRQTPCRRCDWGFDYGSLGVVRTRSFSVSGFPHRTPTLRHFHPFIPHSRPS